jgi:curli biogenesis system outer membrane secretion channel CsgG
MKVLLRSAFICLTLLAGCAAQETERTIEAPQVNAPETPYTGKKAAIAIGKFDNSSSYMRGIFSDNQDQLGSQAKTILTTHLQQSSYFSVLDRMNTSEAKREADYNKKAQSIKGATLLVTGNVTEFGRKEVGDQQLFGILGRGKSQVAYAKVQLNIVNVDTSEVIQSAQGAGEYALSNREIAGFGSTASYDSTLNGKVLDLAIRNAVNNLTQSINSGKWKPE